MKPRQKQQSWKIVVIAALASVVAFASPAAAAVPSTTTVQAVPAAATVGEQVTLNATVTCSADPSGGLGVTFFDGPDLLTTVPVTAGGSATYATTFTTAGSHLITAAYNGNDNCSASNSETTVTVSSAPTPPTPPTSFCLLVCGSLIGFTVGDINNVTVIR
ncbi:Ig-like domain-containing protein [Streptomyces sp. NBC_01476]|uniref:Ig-like domain-containing protein n=1 Tax=Streptomyces sp. NBC_01476 TaxID=2903881 RepID=UPI002E2F7B5F|nr:Ig-like domain-containing protein [Streptomyces sp. NBC_01476]